MSPQIFLLAVFLLCSSDAAPPNIILIFADDMGYGDLGVYGHPTSHTPNLDSMAARGLRFTDFYTTGAVCSPSRAGLLTGRFQTRSGVYPGVFYPSSVGGLPLGEVTIAEVLQSRGYVTAMAGKWHLGLGLNGTFLPTRQGFQHFLGVPYSHDQGPCHGLVCFPPDTRCYGTCDLGESLLPVFIDEKILQQPVNFTELVPLYEQFIRSFIQKAAEQSRPFFLYYAAHHTHYPQFASARYTGQSMRGKYGDALLEFDGTVGDILKTVWDLGIQNNTLFIFTSDNGPETMRKERGGTSGILKCGKSTTYEGGLREPAIMYWEGKIKPGVTSELASTLDILPTLAALAGARLPDVTLDGYDLSELLLHNEKSPRKTFYYYPPDIDPQRGIFALRMGRYKAHFYTRGAFHSETTPDPDCHITATLTAHNPPLLFDLWTDPAENYNLLKPFIPKDLEPIVAEILSERDRFHTSMDYAPSELNKGEDPSLRPCCNPECSPKPSCCHCFPGGGDDDESLERILMKAPGGWDDDESLERILMKKPGDGPNDKMERILMKKPGDGPDDESLERFLKNTPGDGPDDESLERFLKNTPGDGDDDNSLRLVLMKTPGDGHDDDRMRMVLMKTPGDGPDDDDLR